ncbi:hypothetical protein [Candidatus Midichloria mitochondrii]|nr:hypothetical protein [Candidatus Midichloria mitochondrii]
MVYKQKTNKNQEIGSRAYSLRRTEVIYREIEKNLTVTQLF